MVGETKLLDYSFNKPLESHGLTGIVYLADGSMLFTTSLGTLYRIDPAKKGPAKVTLIDWFHPRGTAYAPSLFTFAGKRYVCGIARRPKEAFEWVVFDLETKRSVATPLELPGKVGSYHVLYGSVTRDGDGRFYIVGSHRDEKGVHPLVFRVRVEDKR